MRRTAINHETEHLIRRKIQENFENGKSLYKLFHRIGYNKTHNYHDASDIAANATLDMWMGAGTYEFPVYKNVRLLDDTRALNWAWQIGENAFVNFLRKENRYIKSKNLDHRDYFIIRGYSSDGIFRGDEPCSESIEMENLEIMRKVINEQMSKIPAKFREVLIMNYFEGKRYREIAEELNIPIRTVKSRLHNAKIKLKKSLMGLDKYLYE